MSIPSAANRVLSAMSMVAVVEVLSLMTVDVPIATRAPVMSVPIGVVGTLKKLSPPEPVKARMRATTLDGPLGMLEMLYLREPKEVNVTGGLGAVVYPCRVLNMTTHWWAPSDDGPPPLNVPVTTVPPATETQVNVSVVELTTVRTVHVGGELTLMRSVEVN